MVTWMEKWGQVLFFLGKEGAIERPVSKMRLYRVIQYEVIFISISSSKEKSKS